jgi:hypothetical protein
MNNHDLAKTLAINAYHSADQFSWEKRAARLQFFHRVYAGRGKINRSNIHSEWVNLSTALFGVDDLMVSGKNRLLKRKKVSQ